ncbi:MAG: hypothetical protein UX17_C0037G0008 [Parcubacteria group bacterium GW2011_GWC2_45_7]|nr:MAG: hypothetical protein UX17_C0037G0008 [Parcubacteria group bacterium GW2011_GWC2_45_7]HIH29872.1 HNH endonuclease [Candidatus Micrarchaeota archaeon]
MKRLYLSFAPPKKWRNGRQKKWLEGTAWKRLRQKTMDRHDYACVYCGYRSEKYQIADHIDGDPENNADSNLQVVCQMCNLIKHSGQGCVIVGIVDLYKKSRFSQNEIMRLTHEMRGRGASDARIIRHLGLEEKARFRQDRGYLKGLYGFVTSKPSFDENDMYSKWLGYRKSHNSEPKLDEHQTRLTER